MSARHARTVRWLAAVVVCEPARGKCRCSSRASSPSRRRCEVVLVVVLRCSAVSQSRHVGPGGVTRDAATTTRPQSAVYFPWPATSPAVVACWLSRWLRPSAVLVIVVGRVMRRRIWSTVGMAEPFRHRWGLHRPRRRPPPGPLPTVIRCYTCGCHDSHERRFFAGDRVPDVACGAEQPASRTTGHSSAGVRHGRGVRAEQGGVQLCLVLVELRLAVEPAARFPGSRVEHSVHGRGKRRHQRSSRPRCAVGVTSYPFGGSGGLRERPQDGRLTPSRSRRPLAE